MEITITHLFRRIGEEGRACLLDWDGTDTSHQTRRLIDAMDSSGFLIFVSNHFDCFPTERVSQRPQGRSPGHI